MTEIILDTANWTPAQLRALIQASGQNDVTAKLEGDKVFVSTVNFAFFFTSMANYLEKEFDYPAIDHSPTND